MRMSRHSTCIALITLLVIGIAHSGLGMAAQSPTGASAAPASSILLTEDLLNRMIAVAREAQTLDREDGADDEDDDDESDDDGASYSTEAMGDKMDANPVARALFRRHGLTGRSYMLATKTLARAGGVARMAGTKWASRIPGSAAVDPRNVTFYNEHKAQIFQLAALQNPDSSPEEDERLANSLRGIDPDDINDCTVMVVGAASLTPHLFGGPNPLPTASRLKLADATEDTVVHFNSPRLKKDFTILASEIRRHVNVRETPGAFLTALDDVTDWGKTHCQGANSEP